MKRLLGNVGGFIALPILLCVSARAQERVAIEAPRQVFMVNTQDASVSLVDMATMKEIRRIPVEPRPYGVVVSRDGRRLAVGVPTSSSWARHLSKRCSTITLC